MIYIISDQSDITTDIVVEYLIGMKAPFKRINKENKTEISLNLKNSGYKKLNLTLNDKPITKKDKVWLRRARLSFFPKKLENENPLVKNYLLHEENSFNKSLEYLLHEDNLLVGSYLKEVENYKILNLFLAQKVGFSIPETIVTTNRKDAIAFFTKHSNGVITKDLRYPINLNFEEYFLTTVGTIEVNLETLESMSDTFFPLFLQEKIKKFVELRVFVFKNKLYPMAIFSQNNEQTRTDYRVANSKNLNRLVPFKFPAKINKMIIDFMKTTGLDSGSIDLILTPNGKYVFLEINPQGQIDWLSKNCNYYIERDIANYLNTKK